MREFLKFMDVAEPVALALNKGQPVVALESTIITHGMPYPQNAEMAAKVEDIIVSEGAVPATIAVIDGRLKIGLTDFERNNLAKTTGAMKASRADFAFAIAQKRTAGTTVAATMMGAELAGIAVFATGGIGGVHMGAELSFDISADLEELSRTPVIVVCAGAKAILDLGKTLEVLETKGVPVVGFGVDMLPAFWSRKSTLPIPLRLDSAVEIAAFEHTRRTMGSHGGMLICNPIPFEAEIAADRMGIFIKAAQSDADEQGITGKAVTPFLLKRIFELSSGESLKANIALVENNARVAARIAVSLSA
ncbi:MAG: pseudouridine-5'-phosphate glycosidase [Notoacmeibacter sp.]